MPKTQGHASVPRQLRRIFPVLLFAFSLAFTWYTAYTYSHTILDSDASSELVLAKLLSQQNAIISADWYYSTELRFMHINLVYAPLFKVFTSWHTVRFAGVLILHSIFLLSYLSLCRQARLGWRAFLYSASILILPYSISYGRIVLYHNHYIVYATLGFGLVGLYLSVLGHGMSRPFGRYLKQALLLILSLLAGLNGVRQLAVTMAPLLLTALWMALRKEEGREGPASATLWERWRGMLLSLQVCLFGGAGYLINSHVLAKSYVFRSYAGTSTSFISSENLMAMLQAFFSHFGFQTGRSLFSLGGILACGGVLAGMYMLAQGAKNLSARAPAGDLGEAGPSQNRRFIGAYAPIAWAVTAFSFVFSNVQGSYVLYFIPVALWAVPMLALQLEKQPAKGPLGRLLLTGLCLVFLANGIYNNAYFLNPQNQGVTYDGLGWQRVDGVQRLQGAVDFLRDNGYTLGYATFWNANIVTEMTDGAIPMVNIQINWETQTSEYRDWLTDRRYREEAFAQGHKAFFLLTPQESERFILTPQAEMSYAYPVYEDSEYVIYACDDSWDTWDAMQE